MKTLIWSLGAAILITSAGCARDGHDGADGRAATPIVQTADQEGGMTGGGGSDYVQEIALFSHAIVEYLKKHPLPEVPVMALEKAIKETKITMKPQLIHADGKPRTALNYADRTPPEIEFSIEDLDKIRGEKDRIIRIILHEFLGILKINDLPNYDVSNKLNAPEIARRISIGNGTYVPTRLLTVKLNSQPLECTDVTDDKSGLRALDCSTRVQTEDIIGFEKLLVTCSSKIKLEHPQNMVVEGDYYGIITKFTPLSESGPLGNFQLGIRQSTREDVNGKNVDYKNKLSTAEFKKMLESCTLKILLYPDSQVGE